MKVKIQTTLGDIVVRLFDETPLHRDNFAKLAKEGYYDGTLFHRVIKDFMIQGGDPDSKNAPAGKHLGMGGPGYTIDAEIKDLAAQYGMEEDAVKKALSKDMLSHDIQIKKAVDLVTDSAKQVESKDAEEDK